MILYDSKGNVVFDNANDLLPYVRRTGNMASGEAWEMETNHVIKNNVFVFTAYLSTMGTISIGKRPLYNNGFHVKVTPTQVVIMNGDKTVSTNDHGLTISDTIQIIVMTAPDSYTATVKVATKGNEYKLENVPWGTTGITIGNLFCEVTGTSLTNCTFMWTCRDFSAPVWAFGDSWFNIESVERWTHYLIADGFGDNVLLNGYGGEASNNAIEAFRSLLTHGKPKYIMWCMGMNDGADSTFKSCFDEVKKTCEEKGIVLIATTIPNAVSYTYAKDKNQYLRDSGVRIVDFAKCCGADGTDRVWFDGMGTSDGIHPTENGAKALWAQVLSDFPEITQR